MHGKGSKQRTDILQMSSLNAEGEYVLQLSSILDSEPFFIRAFKVPQLALTTAITPDYIYPPRDILTRKGTFWWLCFSGCEESSHKVLVRGSCTTPQRSTYLNLNLNIKLPQPQR